MLELPSGHIDDGELPEETARRAARGPRGRCHRGAARTDALSDTERRALLTRPTGCRSTHRAACPFRSHPGFSSWPKSTDEGDLGSQAVSSQASTTGKGSSRTCRKMRDAASWTYDMSSKP